MLGDLRSVHSAETAYYLGPGRSTYGDFLAMEGNNYLPGNFSAGATSYARFGYNGTLALVNNNSGYQLMVQGPIISLTSPSYYMDESGVIRYNNTSPATANDLPVGSK